MKLSSSRFDMENSRLERPTIKNYSETVVGGAGGAATTVNYSLDLSQGNIFHLILSVSITNLSFFYLPPVRDVVRSFTLVLRQDSTGNRTVVWPTSVNWVNASIPTLTTNANSRDVFTFFTTDGGTSWHGSLVAADSRKNYTLWSFGRNNFGQLGDGTTVNKSSPIQIGTLTNWSCVSGGMYHSLAIKTNGTLWSFGRNSDGTTGFGQLGDGTTTNKSSPIQIGTLTDWSRIEGGREHSLALKTDGTLWAFGRNNYGQLGYGTTAHKSSPVQIGSLTDWASISCGGFHSFALKTDGTLWAFGRNNYGQLGDGTIIDRSSPTKIGSLTDWMLVMAGGPGSWQTCALKTDGTLWSFGRNNVGQLGDGTIIDRSSPVQIGSLTNWASIAGGGSQFFVAKTDGTLWDFGVNSSGQLGDGTTTDKSSPIQIGSLTNWANIGSGRNHFFSIKTDGTLWTFGFNIYGQLGNGTVVYKSSPVQIGSLTSWASATGGWVHSLALRRG